MRCNSNCAVLVFIGASVYIMCVGIGAGANISLKNAVLSPILIVKTVKNRRNLRFLTVILLDMSLF